MERGAAHALCREKCLKETTVRHLISVEGVMRALARIGDTLAIVVALSCVPFVLEQG